MGKGKGRRSADPTQSHRTRFNAAPMTLWAPRRLETYDERERLIEEYRGLARQYRGYVMAITEIALGQLRK